MSLDGQLLGRKPLRAVTGKTANWHELAKDCVAFANAAGGRLLLGIEDDRHQPPAEQRIPSSKPSIDHTGQVKGDRKSQGIAQPNWEDGNA